MLVSQIALFELKTRKTCEAKILRANFKRSNASLAASKQVDPENIFLSASENSQTEEISQDSHKLEVLSRKEATVQLVQTPSNNKVLK